MMNKKSRTKEQEAGSLQGKNRINSKFDLEHAKSLAKIKEQAVSCNLCKLYKTQKSPIFGVGNENAKLMFVGEAPGATEELQGKPFVGRAGKLLNELLKSIGLKREEVYITNVLKCRPPNNRTPLPQEIKLCSPYLQREIALIQPKIIVALGRIAAQFLLNTTEPMGRLRSNIYHYDPQTILLVTYHPAYLLRVPEEKPQAYMDFLMIKKILDEQL